MQGIIDVVRVVLPQAGHDYQSMSLECLGNMPERWVQCKLGEALHADAHCRVRLEMPVEEMGLRELDGLRNGKVDIAAYSDATCKSPSFVIEVKCNRSSWGSVTADA